MGVAAVLELPVRAGTLGVAVCCVVPASCVVEECSRGVLASSSLRAAVATSPPVWRGDPMGMDPSSLRHPWVGAVTSVVSG